MIAQTINFFERATAPWQHENQVHDGYDNCFWTPRIQQRYRQLPDLQAETMTR
jgi:hypothetical protein